jgi:TolB-like protein
MSLIKELKRRNVIRVAVAYVIVAWLLLQVSDTLVPALHLPEWLHSAVALFLILGFPLAMIFAWAYELTPDGLKKDKDVDRSASTTHTTGRKLDFIIIGVLAIAIGFLLVDKFYLNDQVESLDEIVETQHQSIAVLPFLNISDDPDYFADGLSEELMNLLAKNPDLRVAGRTSSFAFKGQTPIFQEVGEALNVSYVLEGSVRRSGDTLRITAQLISVESGHHLWSETYDEQMSEIFQIQDAVAGEIATQLKIRLMPESIRPTKNIDAYVLYLQAVALSASNNDEVIRSIEFLDSAIALDPDFAKAYELKAQSYWETPYNVSFEEARRITYESASKALELDPTLVLARPLLSAKEGGMRWVKYMEMMDQAVAGEPENVRLLNSHVWGLSYTGYFEDALQIARRITSLEPLRFDGYFHAASALIALGRRKEARDIFHKGIEMGWPHLIVEIAWDHFLSGEFELAIAPYEEFLEIIGEDPGLARKLVDGATNPETGKKYLDEFIIAEEEYPSWATAYSYRWYLPFGYIDEFWEIAKAMETDTLGPWKGGFELRWHGTVSGVQEFRSHPYYITQEKIDLWDLRGAPDTCSKSSGQWVCN